MYVEIYVETTWFATASSNGWWSGCTTPTPRWMRSTAAVHPSTRGRGSMTCCLAPLTASHQVWCYSDCKMLVFTSWVMLCAELMLHYCFSEFASYQSLKFESISVEAFTFGLDQYVVFAQPFAGTCNFLEWDHVEMTFRTYDTIESELKRAVLIYWFISGSSELLSPTLSCGQSQNLTWGALSLLCFLL